MHWQSKKGKRTRGYNYFQGILGRKYLRQQKKDTSHLENHEKKREIEKLENVKFKIYFTVFS